MITKTKFYSYPSKLPGHIAKMEAEGWAVKTITQVGSDVAVVYEKNARWTSG